MKLRREFVRADGSTERVVFPEGQFVRFGHECVVMSGSFWHLGTHVHPDGSRMVTTVAEH